MRFTPDARHLIIAERRNNRLSVFTPLGEFLCHIGAGVIDNPHDIDFADNGDLIVPELDDGRVCILSPMSLTEPPVLLRRFSGFQYPTAVLMHAGELYVLEEEARELRVFT